MNRCFYLIFIFYSTFIYSQTFQNFNVSVNFNYTNTSKFYLQPDSPDPVVRSSYNELNDIISLSTELSIQMLENLYAGFWIEYVEKNLVIKNYNLGQISLDINDGYKIIPFEITLYYLLPFSTEKFKFYMGGGAGFYFGKSNRNFENIYAVNDKINFDFGIQVSFTMDYIINSLIFLRTQMRFRDPNIELKSKYSDNSLIHNGRRYYIYPQTFTTKTNVDGISFCLGIGIHF
ncbi:hypothetical protein [Rosettibacter firmus]|uniref:hypothetical protein n=1 Tax=Rosettibacter firmus TaxID=3111522 RepID=UPI00336BCA50